MDTVLPDKYSISKVVVFCMAKSKKELIIMLQNNTFSQFRKLELSCLHALFFISLVALILFIATKNAYSAQVKLAWNPNTESDLAGYKIYRDNTQIATTSNTFYQDTGLSPLTTYVYTVSAYDAAGNESSQSTPVSATTQGTAGDIDGNGQYDVIIDYGNGLGIWTLMNNSTWIKLSSLSPETMTTGDIDGNGQDDIIIDFGPGRGIWTLMNRSTWMKLHTLSPETMTTGDMDGNGQDDIIVDFGDPYGISVLMNNSTWKSLALN
jgi:hypothetical protein